MGKNSVLATHTRARNSDLQSRATICSTCGRFEEGVTGSTLRPLLNDTYLPILGTVLGAQSHKHLVYEISIILESNSISLQKASFYLSIFRTSMYITRPAIPIMKYSISLLTLSGIAQAAILCFYPVMDKPVSKLSM